MENGLPLHLNTGNQLSSPDDMVCPVFSSCCFTEIDVMGFSGQEHWSGLLGPPPGESSQPRIEPTSLTSTCTGRQVLYH